MMRSWILAGALNCILLVGWSQEPFVCDGQFFLSLTEDLNSRVVTIGIDPANDSVSFNPLFDPLGLPFNSMGYRPTDNLIYGVNISTQELVRIDATGDVTALAALPMNPQYIYLAGDISIDGRYLWVSGGTGAALTGKDKELIRVDLEDPDYSAEVFALGGPEVRMLDIAFDPLSGVLYGFDSFSGRLVIIDQQTAEISTPFPSVSGVASSVGSLFFDAFGQLWGYGNTGSGAQNTLFLFNKLTGSTSPQATGPPAQGTDACSCPYTVELSKLISPRLAEPCDEVVFSYLFANASGYDQSGLNLYDTLPPDFLVTEVVSEPSTAGNWSSGLGSSIVNYADFSIGPGLDSLVIKVSIPPGASGRYPTQARLSGLPPTLGSERLSDDPLSLNFRDSTLLQVNALRFDTLEFERSYCFGDTLWLASARQGEVYQWSTGSTASEIPVTESGIYSVAVATGCDTSFLIYDIKRAGIKVSFPESPYSLDWDETLTVLPDIVNSGQQVQYHWLSDRLDCLDCPSQQIGLGQIGRHELQVTNEFDCTDTAILELVFDPNRDIYLPTAFSPNLDGVNDLFYPQGPPISRIYYFRIFDRWGNLVHDASLGEINDVMTAWDGAFRGQPMPEGVYIWSLAVVFPDNEIREFSGEVQLIR